MKVILLQDIKGTGKKDQIIEVSDGFARNYLFPKKLASEANAVNLNSIENQKSAMKHKEELLKQAAEEFALAMNESLPKTEQCQHQFSEEFERKMQLPCPLFQSVRK